MTTVETETRDLSSANTTSDDEQSIQIVDCKSHALQAFPSQAPDFGIDFHLDDAVFLFNTNTHLHPHHNCSNSNYSNVSDYEEYVYDYSNADQSLPLDEVLPVSLLYGITLVVGVVGNLLVIAAVARDRRLRSITNIFLCSLATADLALLCFCVPVKVGDQETLGVNDDNSNIISLS